MFAWYGKNIGTLRAASSYVSYTVYYLFSNSLLIFVYIAVKSIIPETDMLDWVSGPNWGVVLGRILVSEIKGGR